MGGALCGVTAATGGLGLDAVVGASVGLRLYERRRAAVETVAAHVPLLGAARAFGGVGGVGGVCVVGVLWAGVGAGEVVDVSMRCDRNHGVVLAAAGSGGTHWRRDRWGGGKVGEEGRSGWQRRRRTQGRARGKSMGQEARPTPKGDRESRVEVRAPASPSHRRWEESQGRARRRRRAGAV